MEEGIIPEDPPMGEDIIPEGQLMGESDDSDSKLIGELVEAAGVLEGCKPAGLVAVGTPPVLEPAGIPVPGWDVG